MSSYPLTKPTPAASTSESDGMLIELKEVNKVFDTTAGKYLALKNVNLGFSGGEFTSIMGKSGSGKSTLINMITGIDHPTSGSVRVGDALIHKMNEEQLAIWRGRTLGIVFQFFQLLPTLSVLENTMLPMDFCNMYAPGEREDRALEVLRRLHLEDVVDKLPAALSGGQQQVAAIARALANDPPILIADEPTGNLDSRTAEHVLEILGELADQGKTILIVTHDPALATRSNRRVLISDGEMIDEWVAEALPGLPHPLLLRINQLAVPRRYESGSVLAGPGVQAAGLFIVRQGEVEVMRQNKRSLPETVGHIQPGQAFSRMDLLESPSCSLSFQTAHDRTAEVLYLEPAQLDSLISEVPNLTGRLRHIAQERSELFCLPPRRKLGGGR